MKKDRVRANDTAYPVTRRAVLASLPVVGLASTAWADNADAELLSHYREYLDAYQEYEFLTGVIDDLTPETERVYSRKEAALDKLTTLTPSTMGGIFALAHVLWLEEGPSFLPGTEGHAREMTSPRIRLMSAILRGAGAKKHIT